MKKPKPTKKQWVKTGRSPACRAEILVKAKAAEHAIEIYINDQAHYVFKDKTND